MPSRPSIHVHRRCVRTQGTRMREIRGSLPGGPRRRSTPWGILQGVHVGGIGRVGWILWRSIHTPAPFLGGWLTTPTKRHRRKFSGFGLASLRRRESEGRAIAVTGYLLLVRDFHRRPGPQTRGSSDRDPRR